MTDIEEKIKSGAVCAGCKTPLYPKNHVQNCLKCLIRMTKEVVESTRPAQEKYFFCDNDECDYHLNLLGVLTKGSYYRREDLDLSCSLCDQYLSRLKHYEVEEFVLSELNKKLLKLEKN